MSRDCKDFNARIIQAYHGFNIFLFYFFVWSHIYGLGLTFRPKVVTTKIFISSMVTEACCNKSLLIFVGSHFNGNCLAPDGQCKHKKQIFLILLGSERSGRRRVRIRPFGELKVQNLITWPWLTCANFRTGKMTKTWSQVWPNRFTRGHSCILRLLLAKYPCYFTDTFIEIFT